jgi:putative spermidine/putrescine transport system permease protein
MAGTELMAQARTLRAGADPTGVKANLLLALPLAAAAALLILPLTALLSRAVSEKGAGFYITVMSEPLFREALGRTILLAATVMAICAIVGTIYAIAIISAPSLYGRILLAVLISSFWISLLVRTFGWVLLFQPNGVLDQLVQALGLTSGGLDLYQTAPAMYPAMVHIMLPFFVLPVYTACLRPDPSLLRAGESLGGKPGSVLLHVVLSHLRPAILAAASLVFMLSLAFYVTPLLIGGPTQLTVATLIDREFNVQVDLGSAAAMGIVLLVIVLVLYVIVDRYFSLVPVQEEKH